MDEQQSSFMKIAERGHNVLLTGCPGTGKTYILSKIIDKLSMSGRRVVLTASTGKAASVLKQYLCTELSITTIHRFTGIKDGRFGNEEILNLILCNDDFNRHKCNILNVDVLIIDEVSMLSRKVFTQIEFFLRHVRTSEKPFGGVQVILSGDFYQLPPVPTPEYGVVQAERQQTILQQQSGLLRPVNSRQIPTGATYFEQSRIAKAVQKREPCKSQNCRTSSIDQANPSSISCQVWHRQFRLQVALISRSCTHGNQTS